MLEAIAVLATLLSGASAPAPFRSLAELDAAMSVAERSGDAEPFWSRIRNAGRMPLLFGDMAVFFHRSPAARVEWRGDFTDWEPSPAAQGRRVGKTDVWTFRRTFRPDARLDYKLVEDGERWLVDPLNPQRQLGGYGPNSEIRMPGWKPPAHVVRDPGVPRGSFGPPEPIASRKLGYAVNVRVYEPAGARTPGARLPVLYVTDGSDYWNDDMGSLVITLDNLIASRRIPPLFAVFVDPWDPEHKANRREAEFVPGEDRLEKPIGACPFCEFLADELAPAMERRLPIDPARRGILGTSLGGFNAAFMGLRHPEQFSLLGIQSPALSSRKQPWLESAYAAAPKLPRRAVIDVGLYEEGFLERARGLRSALAARGVRTRHIEVPQGHSWGHWRATAAEMLEFLYGER